MAIASIQAAQAYAKVAAPQAPTGPGQPGGVDFSSTMSNALNTVNEMQMEGDAALEMLASGEQVDLHGTMVALEKADVALRTMVSVRDRVVQAYEQVMNMAI